HLNLGIGLEAAGDIDAAIRSYEAALAIDPRDPYANYDLGKLLCGRGDLERAEPLIRAALDCKPEFPEAQVVLSNLYESRGDLAAAVIALESALKQRPDWGGVLFNYAVMLWKLRRISEAETALRRAIAIDPGLVPAYGLLGNILRGQARIPEALEVLGVARKLDPGRLDIESTELFMLTCWDEISSEALFVRHKDFGVRLERAIARRFDPFGNSRDPGRRLRTAAGDCEGAVVGFREPDREDERPVPSLRPACGSGRHDRAVSYRDLGPAPPQPMVLPPRRFYRLLRSTPVQAQRIHHI